MHIVFKISSIVLRCLELISAVVVAGLVGYLIHKVDSADGGNQSDRVLYAEAVAAIGILASLILLPPFAYAFSIFAIASDAAMFVMWIIAFSLLAARDITHDCNSTWYREFWGFYWRDSCKEWDSVLAFSFIAWVCFLASMCIGVWIFMSRRKEVARSGSTARSEESEITQLKKKRKLPWMKEKSPLGQTNGTVETTDGAAV